MSKGKYVKRTFPLAGLHCAGCAARVEKILNARVYEVALAADCELSFPIIATINGQFLHNHYHGNTIKNGQLFLLDAGYETPMGYAGDMSSTFPVAEKFTERQKEIYRYLGKSKWC